MNRLQHLLLLCLFALIALTPAGNLAAAQTETPTTVTLIGTFQPALGCTAVWQADCEATVLPFDEIHQLWIASFELPAGIYEYKVALNGSLDETYGALAELNGENALLELTEPRTVTFFYSHDTHWIADDVNFYLANIPGSHQGEVGCPSTSLSTPENDWAPDCLQTLLQDPDADGLYEYRTSNLPAGNYEAKVAVNQSWSENYGDAGAPGGANLAFTVPKDNAEVLFQWDSTTKVLIIQAEGAPKGNFVELKGYWLSQDTIATAVAPEEGLVYQLAYSADGTLTLDETGIVGGELFTLTPNPAGFSETILQKFPHLVNLTPLIVPAEVLPRIPELLRGQVVLAISNAAGEPVDAFGLQLPGVIDELYTYDGALGITYAEDVPTLQLWAPTAQKVRLFLFNDPTLDPSAPSEIVEMSRDNNTGVWSVAGTADWTGQYYLYEVTVYAHAATSVVTNLVTDPYSFSLATNSQKSQIVNLADLALAPAGWDSLAKPPLTAPEDIVLYELHVRDFSIFDESVPAEQRGTFMAFTHPDSNGMSHLQQLAQAGLTHVHLLPVFDIATINEVAEERREPSLTFLARGEADAEMQQNAINALRDSDGFNWGYDPFHYTVPEGSYSTNPQGSTRIVEFRSMVQGLNQAGLRVVMDVVYNHTNSSGQDGRSVLDRVVPGYYHRLTGRGRVETSTCCQNTATEHNMMRKLMVDSVVTWAVAYKVDGFRFDLMGHHMLADMVAVREALDSLTLEKDGVDGRNIYVYGEGWNFGEVVNNTRGVNATQLNIATTGIGVFNDRLRDAVRGGNPFGGQTEQGFATGLYVYPNDTDQGTSEEQLAHLLLFSDQIRVGLAGNLANYEFVGANGELITGAEVDYNGNPAGYTADPQENIIYASAHDNETLFDVIQYKLPLTATMEERINSVILAEGIVMFSQGVPFFHAGTEILRSKSLDRNSYNSGDWFNLLDFTYQTNNWGVGLPPAGDNQESWRLIKPLLDNPELKPDPAEIVYTLAQFQELLAIRQSSPLFRLPTAEEVQTRVKFYNTGPEQIPGLIVMELDDTAGESLDPTYDRLVVFFNSAPEPRQFVLDGLGEMVVHPVQQLSVNPAYQQAGYEAGVFNVPGQSVVVFVQVQEGATLPEVEPVELVVPELAMTATPEPTATPQPTATVEPTAVPTVAPTATLEPVATATQPAEVQATNTAAPAATATPQPVVTEPAPSATPYVVVLVVSILGLALLGWIIRPKNGEK